MSTPDPKPPVRVRDPDLLRALHFEWRGECVIADEECVAWRSLHHVLKRSQGGDDVRANFAMLCGDGIRGHHGRIEAHDPSACAALYVVLKASRPDTMDYLASKLGGAQAATEWLTRHLYAAA
jgi:hypothetical protein